MSDDLLRRLRLKTLRQRVRWGRAPKWGEGSPVNPDGPEAAARIEALEAENKRLRGALTPSGETKAAYIGEFKFDRSYTDENGDETSDEITVPWTTIKEIMAAISRRAAAALESKP